MDLSGLQSERKLSLSLSCLCPPVESQAFRVPLLHFWLAPQAAEIRRELAEGAGAVVENSPLPLPDDVVRCSGTTLEGEQSELELVRRIRREAPPMASPPSEAAAARGSAGAGDSIDEELVRACRESKLVERQKELLSGAVEAKVLLTICLINLC